MIGKGKRVIINIAGNDATTALVLEVTPNVKDNWWDVKMELADKSIITWTVRTLALYGDPFTMGGNETRLIDNDAPTFSTEIETRPTVDISKYDNVYDFLAEKLKRRGKRI